jgi:predicted nucleic acid-binding protein
MMTKARSVDGVVGTSDGYIAAIAATHGLAVATRDTAPFDAFGLKVINPWKSPTSRG